MTACMFSFPVCVHVTSSRMPFAAAQAIERSFMRRREAAPAPVAANDRQPVLAFAGSSAQRIRPAKPTISPSASATNDPPGSVASSASQFSIENVEPVDRHVLVALLRQRPRLAQEFGPRLDRHELDARRLARRPADAVSSVEHLLDVAARLLEAEAARERDRPLVGSCDVRARALEPALDRQFGEPSGAPCRRRGLACPAGRAARRARHRCPSASSGRCPRARRPARRAE